MRALTVLGEKFQRCQDQVKARFDSLGEQVAFGDRKISIGAEFEKPQVYPSKLSEATQSPPHS